MSFSSCLTELSSFQGIWQESYIGLRSATDCNPYHELPHLEAPLARSLYASSSFLNSSSHHITLRLRVLAHRSSNVYDVSTWALFSLSVAVTEHVPSSQRLLHLISEVVPICVDSNACYTKQETSSPSHPETMSSFRWRPNELSKFSTLDASLFKKLQNDSKNRLNFTISL